MAENNSAAPQNITISEICLFASASPSSRNFIEGERLINSGHLLNIGKKAEKLGGLCVVGFCLQTSHLRDKPHEIILNFDKNVKIISAGCTCKAGRSEKCKHIVALLMYCNRNDMTQINSVSCTDEKCSWKTCQSKSLEKYLPAPLRQHECFQIQESKKDKYSRVITEEQQELIEKILFSPETDSALSKHKCGRHDPVSSSITIPTIPETSQFFETIFANQTSSMLLQALSEIPVHPQRECCQKFIATLNNDSLSICKDTYASHISWEKERQYRITGSRCYAIFTYINNKNPDWKKKSTNYFFPEKFTNQSVRHGIKNESNARTKYEEITSQRVVQCGLITHPQNCWLGYSPDGVIYNGDNPDKLLEIKCPFDGRKDNIHNIMENLKYLTKDLANNFTLKKKHMYYAQVQMGMAVLNLKRADFVVYASHDGSLVSIPVQFDEMYATQLLVSLKSVYFNIMIHHICTPGVSDD